MSLRYLLGIVSLLVPGTVFAQAFPDHCSGGTPLPFSAIEVKHPIDSSCGIEGTSSAPANSHIQNKVKNNFCATAPGGTPEEFTPQMLIDLQAKTTIPSGHGKEPADRTALQDLGEGKLVRMKAFLVEAHFADLGGGESVNCNGGKEPDNDIHMALGPKADTQECDSVSAEITPHFRPTTWEAIGHDEIYNSTTHKYTTDPSVDSRLRAHAYRITGQLFFDSSHEACPCNKACSPIRASVWEIHPIDNIEVCRAGTTCDENTNSDWLEFDKWWTSMTPIKKPKGPHTHNPHEPRKARSTGTHQ
jgi:hypothetical protein